jgi:hypothetical protein
LGLQQPAQPVDKETGSPAHAAHLEAGAPRQLLSHQWYPVFHPAWSPAGTQPTLIAPQVST